MGYIFDNFFEIQRTAKKLQAQRKLLQSETTITFSSSRQYSTNVKSLATNWTPDNTTPTIATKVRLADDIISSAAVEDSSTTTNYNVTTATSFDEAELPHCNLPIT